MQKILIADAAEGFKDHLQRMLSSEYQVACANDGYQAWEMLGQLQPDLLILDAELPGIDGITLLKRMHEEGGIPAVMVVSRTLTDYVVDTLLEMGISYIMRKPCDVRHVAQRADEILLYYSLKGQQIRSHIAEILEELGIPAHLSGAKYLRSAVLEMLKKPNQFMTKELYPTVAKQFGSVGSRVERSIRNAVRTGWSKGKPDAWKAHFGETADRMPVCPSNTEIITHIVQIIKKL